MFPSSTPFPVDKHPGIQKEEQDGGNDEEREIPRINETPGKAFKMKGKGQPVKHRRKRGRKVKNKRYTVNQHNCQQYHCASQKSACLIPGKARKKKPETYGGTSQKQNPQVLAEDHSPVKSSQAHEAQGKRDAEDEDKDKHSEGCKKFTQYKIPFRKGHGKEDFYAAHPPFFGPALHGNGRYHQNKGQGKGGKPGTERGGIHGKEMLEIEKPYRTEEQEEYADTVGNRIIAKRVKLFFCQGQDRHILRSG
jgi:hypothetical protein